MEVGSIKKDHTNTMRGMEKAETPEAKVKCVSPDHRTRFFRSKITRSWDMTTKNSMVRGIPVSDDNIKTRK